MRSPSPYALSLLLLGLCVAGCGNPQRAQYQEGVRDWYSIIERHGWSCEVLGDRLTRWLDANAKSFGRATKLLADQALRYEGDDRTDFLSSLHIEPPPGIRTTLTKCASTPQVKDATTAWLSLISPLLLMEPLSASPLPPLPPPDAISAPARPKQ